VDDDDVFEGLLTKARELRPRLRAEQEATERRGTFSLDMHETLGSEGFYKVQQPRRYGGHELDVPQFLSLVSEIARGCPGTAWCYCLSSGHHIQMAALFDAEIQDEIYGSVSDFLAPCRPIPMGTATWVEEGWQVNGVWDYCSGSPYSTHALLAVRIEGGPHTVPLGLVVVPRQQWSILDNWAGTTLGMAGSGSNSVKVDNAVVPAGYLTPTNMMAVKAGANIPGYQLHGNPMYCGQSAGYSQLEIAAILVGIARAATDEYERLLREKKTSGPNPLPRYNAPEHQRTFAHAVSLADAAHDVVQAGAERYTIFCNDAVNSPDGFSRAGAGRLAMAANQAADLAWQAVDLCFKMSGSSEGARNGSRMQRYYRDFSMARTNMSAKLDMEAQNFAAAYFAG
jgi:3-hydroxy-9,10-secoandrosta-1,3,5(10)-triene-9,17-dione monooxygenase